MPHHRLMLMRHAKSDWSNEGLTDHDRPLNPRGQAAAPRMARWLAETGGLPDLILASTAKRAEQTIDGVMSEWGHEPPIIRTEALYLAYPDRIVEIIRRDSLDQLCILVIAHNPGLAALAGILAKEELIFPTAAVAIFDFDISSWSEISLRAECQLVGYGYPKGLDS